MAAMKAGRPEWKRRAGRMAAACPLTRLHPAVLAKVEGGRLRGPWFVALSGGADSLALLLLVWAHWPQVRARLQVVHFNHRLRGAAAESCPVGDLLRCRNRRVEVADGLRRPTRPEARGFLDRGESRMNFVPCEAGYWTDSPENPEAATAYPEEYLLGLFRKAQMETRRVIPGGWWVNEFAQDILVAHKSS